ncbi:MAG: histidinol dehydrogenase [Eubacteriaceae bacterium]|nr:histidinol dehydrogenase [Eubacteriaceae bacterium]
MKEIKSAKPRSLAGGETLAEDVKKIIEQVRKDGDAALAGFNEQFDDCRRERLRVGRDEIEEAYAAIDDGDIRDMKAAAANIKVFALAQKNSFRELDDFQPEPGIHLGHRTIPVQACCCYVPGGGYPLYSTALMLGIPAKVAGVGRVIACSPTMKGTGRIHPKTLAAMDIAGVDEIYAVGGAQAIAAVSYGTEEIKPVDLIVGPGNSYVTEAKKQCYGKVGIDFLAGPSEVLVIADETAKPDVIAADLLAQSEHDPVAKGLVVTTDETVGKEIVSQVEKELEVLPTADIARRSWNDFGEVLLAEDFEEAVAFANEYAPEHLEVCIKDPEHTVEKLINYGSLFIGQNTAEVFGDYASGTNHTLPTLGAARYTGGVWVGTFMKVCTHQCMTAEAAGKLAPLVSRLAHGEGLEGHALAADKRKK